MHAAPKRFLSVLATALVSASSSLAAITATPVVTGLATPLKIAMTSEGNLLVAEVGTGNNAGRISLIDPATGSRRTLVDGLPSGFAGPVNGQSGPSGLALSGRTLYLTIGTCDAVAAAPTGGIGPNPRPSSPLVCSVLAIQFSANPERTTDTLTLTAADHAALKAGSRVTRDNGAGDPVTFEMIADLPDYAPDPRPNQPDNVRPANPWGLAVLGGRVFVVDSSLNTLITVDLATRAVSTLVTFGAVPNTRGTGPAAVEAVPDSVRVYGNQLLVTLLTGSPYPLGGAQVRLIDPNTGASSPFITGLTSAIDVLPLKDGGFLTLEYTSDALAGAAAATSGRLQWFATPDTTPVVVANTLSTPTRLELDNRTGTVFINEISTNRIVKVSPWSAASALTPIPSRPISNVAVRGNAGLGNDTLVAGFTVESTSRQVLIRGIGPRLTALGVAGALADPRIVVYNSAGAVVAENDNWSATSDADTAQLIDAAAKAGAFPLVAGSRDAALLRTLPPGAYTVHVTGVGGASGISLVEVYQVP